MDFAYNASKFVWFVLRPGNLLLFVILAGTVVAWVRPRRSGRVWLTGVSLVLLVVTLAPVHTWIARPLEDRFPPPAKLPDRIDGILVLGGVIQRHVAEERRVLAVSDSAERFMVPAALALQYPSARLVISGRNEVHETVTAWFAQIGVAPARIEFENKARNTFENAVYSFQMVRPGPGDVWLLVTSAQHMPRAVGVFRKIGWPVIPYPVDYHTSGRETWANGPDMAGNLVAIADALKEWVGLLAYYLMDRTDELWPAPQAS